MSINAQARKERLDTALAYVRHNYSVIPIRCDGSKAPDGLVLPSVLDPREGKEKPSWNPFRERYPTPQELWAWFGESDHGIGIVCGRLSGNLEVLDFDDLDTYLVWHRLVEAERPGAIGRYPRVRTPRGVHVYCHLPYTPPGNRNLALAEGGKKALIQTRGEGGYVLAPGCPPAAHPDGGVYVWETALAACA